MSDKTATIFADGGSRGNPGPAGAGAVIKENDGVVAELARFIGNSTNNVAEYTSLIMGLEKALDLGYECVEVRMDSELVVKQMNGQYRVKNEKLKPLFQEARTLVARFRQAKITHVRREYNKEADRLANKAMDEGA